MLVNKLIMLIGKFGRFIRLRGRNDFNMKVG